MAYRLDLQRPDLSQDIDQIRERVPRTEVTGRMFAYKSSCFLRATMGDEYPTTLREGELHTE